MQILKLFLLFVLSSISYVSQSRPASTVKYKVTPYLFPFSNNYIKHSKIEIVELRYFDDANPEVVQNINSKLKHEIKKLEKKIVECRESSIPHPWGVEFKFEKIIFSSEYLSIVFGGMNVCAGNPIFDKTAYIFSRTTGELIEPLAITTKILRRLGHSPPKLTYGKLEFDEKTINLMISDSKIFLDSYNEKCDFVLKNTIYKIWVDKNFLFLLPEFRRPMTSCYKEYVIKIAKK